MRASGGHSAAPVRDARTFTLVNGQTNAHTVRSARYGVTNRLWRSRGRFAFHLVPVVREESHDSRRRHTYKLLLVYLGRAIAAPSRHAPILGSVLFAYLARAAGQATGLDVDDRYTRGRHNY